MYKEALVIMAFSVCIMAFSACQGESSTGDEQHQEKHEGSHAESHEHADENTAVLTDEQIRAAGIVIGELEEKELSATMKANGILRVPNGNRAQVTAMFGGVIHSLAVELGDQVEKGQLIATISNPQFIQVQEEYLRINSRIILAEQEVSRQNELHAGRVGAKKNLESAQADLATLRTQKASLAEQIRMMGLNPNALHDAKLQSVLRITSPISGTLREMYASIGSYVDVSSPIAEVINNEALHVDLEVYEKDLTGIQPGEQIEFFVTNNPARTYQAEVYNVGASFSGSSKTIAVHSRIVGDKSGLIDGMNITGIIRGYGKKEKAVPNEAIVHAEGKYYVFLVKAAGAHAHEGETTFEKVEVLKGASLLGYTGVQFLKEISLGSKLVVKGGFFVQAAMNNSGEHGHSH